jgi:hypothetical protein
MEVFQMPQHVSATHRIRINAPVAQCHRFFTPAGEELWVEGWRPEYVYPKDGRTQGGMIFTTGESEDFTIWNLVDIDTESYYSRYTRVTPALRTGTVEVRCKTVSQNMSDVEVTYKLTALTLKGEQSLDSFVGEAFAEMIDGWKQSIDQRLHVLLDAAIR